MVDIAAISGLTASLKAAGEITKAMIGLRDASLLQGKVIELQGVILAAQQGALASQADQFALLERVRELEKQIAQIDTWKTEKQRYELLDVGDGVFAYSLKRSAKGTDPEHLLCAKCFHDHKKSFLQATRRVEALRRVYICHECKSEYAFRPVPRGNPPQVISDYDPFQR